MQSQLADAQDQLLQTQQDREYEVRQAGYDGLSEDLDQALEDSLNSVKYNADEQERVISEMLSRVVSNYQDAYGKINQIIANTGIVPSDGFQQVINNIGTQQGAQNQVNNSNTIAPDYTPNDFVTDINTGAIQSGSNQANNDKIQSEIEKEPNTTNRPVAQITLKPTSLSLQEGKSSTIKANIRPTDAANKSVKWSSSNTKVATVSNGVVKAVKAGSAKITCTAQDGSGISASCSVTVTAKPKASKPSTSTSGGDGKPRVGDKATLTGWYYYDSWGKNPAGNRYSGVTNGVVINSYSNKKYGGTARVTGDYDVSISSADGKYQLGWVKLSQLKGYAGGTTRVGSSQLAWTQEEGAEIIVSPSTGAMLTPLKLGDGVIPHNLTKNLFKWGALDPEIVKKCLDSMSNTIANDCISQTVRNITADSQKAARDMMSSVGQMRSENQRPIVVHYDSLLTVNGDIDKEVFPGVKKMCEEACKYTAKEFQKDSRLMGITRTL